MTRITPELRAALEKAAEDNGRSLSQEAERRLRNSFDRTMQRDHQEHLAAKFEGEKTLAAALLLAYIIAALEGLTEARWHEDAYTAAQVGEAARLLFRELAPPGDQGKVPAPIVEMQRRFEPHRFDLAAAVVMGAVGQLRMSSDETPLPEKNEDGSWTHTAGILQRMAFIRRALRLPSPPGS